MTNPLGQRRRIGNSARAGSGRQGIGITRPNTKLGRFSMQFASYDLSKPNDFSIANIRGTPMTMGANYSSYRTFFQSRGLKVDTVDGADVDVYENVGANTVQLRGPAPLHLASVCKYAGFGHRVPKSWEQQILAWSRVNTKMFDFFVNVESHNLAREFNPKLQRIQDTGRTAVLVSDPASGCTHGDMTPNTNGWSAYKCNVINKYEHTFASDFISGQNTCAASYVAGAVACPHIPRHSTLPEYATAGSGKTTFDSDMRVDAYLRANAAAVRAMDDTDGHLRRKMVDNMGQRPYGGTAKPTFPAAYNQAAYQAGHKAYQSYLRAAYGGFPDDWLWANTLDPLGEAAGSGYSAADIMNRWVEFFFLSNAGDLSAAGITELRTRLAAISAAGIRVAVNVEPGNSAGWATGSGAGGTNWTAFHVEAMKAGLIDTLYVCCARTYLFDQPGIFEEMV